MPIMNFDLEDGLPPVSFNLKPDDCLRFMAFMAECQAIKDAQATPPAAQPAPVQESCEYCKRGLKTMCLCNTPPAAHRQWVGLTPEDVHSVLAEKRAEFSWTLIFRAIEAKLREKNGGAA